MRKADDLRKWLMRSVPGLKDDPAQLHIYLSDGGVDFQRGDSLSFGYRYQANVVLTNFAASLDTLFVPLIIWLARHQPDAIDKSERFTYLIDIIDNRRADIQLNLDLDEMVVVSPDSEVEGGYRAEHPEREAFPKVFEGVDTMLSELWLDEMGEVERRVLAASSEE